MACFAAQSDPRKSSIAVIINSIADLREIARRTIPRAIFEYAERGSYDEVTLRRNRSDLEADSPYNTRRYGGLPPGPISSVSESAINAALNPAKTDYIYYVRNVDLNDGSHWFYASAAEFERGKAEYQRWLEKERREKREAEAQQPQ